MKKHIKNYIIFAIILLGITVSSIGMYQASIARNVSRIVFEAAHKHNWFWADGWFGLLMELSRQTTTNGKDRDFSPLTKSFQNSREMTECFSSLRNTGGDVPEEIIIENLVRVFEVSVNQAEQIVWITKMYTTVFGELPLMMECTDHGTMYSSQAIALLSSKQWYMKREEFKLIYKNMKDKEKRYSNLSYKISEKADKLYFLFFCSFCLSVGLFFLTLIRQSHKKAQLKLKNANRILQENEKSLRESEEKHRVLLEEATDPIFSLTSAGQYTYVNRAFAEGVGKQANDIIGKTIWDVFPKEEADSRFGALSHVFETGLEKVIEVRVPQSENDDYYITTMTPIKDLEGRVLSVICTSKNITVRKKIEEALRNSEVQLIKSNQILSTVLEHTHMSIALLDPQFNFILVNQAYANAGKQESSFFPGKNLFDLYPHEENQAIFQRVVDTGELFLVADKQFVYPDQPTCGLTYWDWNLAPVKDDTEKVTGLVLSLVEVTKRKNLEAQLQQAQKMESIGTLAGGIAHDFNNILFPIVGHTEMLLEDLSEDSPLRDSLNEVYTGTLRARDLVKQILTFSSQDSYEIKLIKIQPVLEEVLKLIRSTIPTSIEIKRHISNDCGIIKADPTQIHQVVMNLATNAYHAMEDTGGELKVNLKEIELVEQDLPSPKMVSGPYACLTISDTGIGMAKDLTKKIFDPFFTTKEQGKGTGMGLSVVHGIVKNTGGSIHVESEPGKGTKFRVYLPVVKSSSTQQETQIKESIRGGSERILLVDDENAIAFMEKQMLERLGYSVVSRTSSVDALEAFRANPDKFDLVITDQTMPNMTGKELAKELMSIRPDIPIILCSGFSEQIGKRRAKGMGICAFVMKPVIMRDIAKTIREVLDEKQ